MTVSTKGTFVTEKISTVIDRKVKEKLKIIKESIVELEKLGMAKEEILKMIA